MKMHTQKVFVFGKFCENVIDVMPNHFTSAEKQGHSGYHLLDFEEKKKNFIEKAHAKHETRYIYDEVEFKTGQTKVKIICPNNHSFSMVPDNHLKGEGCPDCHKSEIYKTTDQWILKAKKRHGEGVYPFAKSKCPGCQKQITIECLTWKNEFDQSWICLSPLLQQIFEPHEHEMFTRP